MTFEFDKRPTIKGYPELRWTGKRPYESTQYYPAQLRERYGEETNGWINKIFWGDNLQVMSHLLKEYRGEIDLIYIDPPFDSKADYKKSIRIKSNSATSDTASFEEKQYGDIWNNDGYLQFMYERLIIMRELLSDSGTLYLHCDWHQSSHLRCILDELFGPMNCHNVITWKRSHAQGNAGQGTEHFGIVTDTIFIYSKTGHPIWNQQYLAYSKETIERDYKYIDEVTGERYRLTPVDGPGGASKGNPYYEFLGVSGYWRYSKETMQKLYDNGLLIVTENNLQKKYYEEQARQSRKKVTTWWDTDFLTSSATSYLQKLMGCKAFDNPKSINLLIRMLKMMTHFDKDALILDFFSGSATTAHAVMQLNAEDGGNRRYICVQLPEETPEDSEARKAGYATIPEIAKERIRRSGAKIKADSPLTTQNLDTGFRVYRLDESNYEKVSLSPKEYKQDQLDLFAYNIKRDRTDLDLLYGSMLAWGVRLDLPLQTETMDGCTIYTVNEGELVACFSEGITDKVVTAMADKSPLRVLFRDACFKEDAQKINIYEQFKQSLDWSDNDAFNNIRVI